MELGADRRQRRAAGVLAVVAVMATASALVVGPGIQTATLTIAVACQLALLMAWLFASSGALVVATRLDDTAVEDDPFNGGRRQDDYEPAAPDLSSLRVVRDEAERLMATSGTVHCIVFGIDDFKLVNARLGMAAGDDVLRSVATALAETLPDWHVAPLGSDEFIALSARPLTREERGVVTALEISTTSGTRVSQLSGGETDSSISGRDLDALIRDAQSALAVAKRSGKQRVVAAAPDLRSAEARRYEIAEDVREALETDAFVAWAQPIIDLDTNEPAGLELLARWQRDDGRFESPELFIPVIETLGFSFLLGEFMLRCAIDTLRHMTEIGDLTSFVTINLSASHLAEPLLPSLIAVQLEAHGIAPERLIVELTESEKLPDSEAGRTAIVRLRNLGVGVATDDLGAGWSSLTQMMRAGFTHVKTDRALITATERHGGTELIESIRMIAQGNGQIAIAEGIESAAQLDAVRNAGFRFGQGWLLGRPSPIEVALVPFDRVSFDSSLLADVGIDGS